MYRKSLQEKMVVEVEQPNQEQFLDRVGSLPVVSTAVGQLMVLYNHTKESNRLVKYALETTETGVKTVATTAMPVVNKLEKPIGSLNTFACHQLDKLEQTYPIITEPTDKVLEETKHLYDVTVKPTVDRVSAVKDYGIETYSSVKDNCVNKVTGVKTYTYSKIDDVKQYSMSTLNGALQTPCGQAVTTRLEDVLDATERYVDYLLPEQPTEEGEKVEKTETENAKTEQEEKKTEKEERNTLTRMITITDKVRRRTFGRAMRDLQHAQKRSKESLEKLNFTVDLIQYARTHIDGVQDRVVAAGSKAKAIWDEINQTEEEVEMKELAAGDEDKENVQVSNVTLERRLIATARHMAHKLKRGLATMSDSLNYLPVSLQSKINNTKKYTEEIYQNFSMAKNLDDLPHRFFDQVHEKITYVGETVSSVADYVTTTYSNWLVRENGVTNSDSGEPVPEPADEASEKVKVTEPKPLQPAELVPVETLEKPSEETDQSKV